MGKHSILDQLRQIKSMSVERFGDTSFAAEVFQGAIQQMFAVMPENEQVLIKQYVEHFLTDAKAE